MSPAQAAGNSFAIGHGNHKCCHILQQSKIKINIAMESHLLILNIFSHGTNLLSGFVKNILNYFLKCGSFFILKDFLLPFFQTVSLLKNHNSNLGNHNNNKNLCFATTSGALYIFQIFQD
jgi:hypothetical protein